MKQVQTNNSYLNEKINLRLKNIPKKDIKVLNAYAGDNLIWQGIKKLFEYNINIINIDKKDYNYVYLKGENLKYISGFNLENFDVIDLDCYGMPAKQLEIIFKTKFKGIVFFTFITTGMGAIDHKILLNYGYTKSMLNKAPVLFNKNGFNKFKNYLAKNGINRINYVYKNNKYYGFFKI